MELLILAAASAYILFLLKYATLFDFFREPLILFLKKDLKSRKLVRHWFWWMFDCDLCIGFHINVTLCLFLNYPPILCLASPIIMKILLNQAGFKSYTQ